MKIRTTTEQRVKLLTDLGLVYSEKYRNFYHKYKGKIDDDIVVYGNEEEFEKQINKLRK